MTDVVTEKWRLLVVGIQSGSTSADGIGRSLYGNLYIRKSQTCLERMR